MAGNHEVQRHGHTQTLDDGSDDEEGSMAAFLKAKSVHACMGRLACLHAWQRVGWGGFLEISARSLRLPRCCSVAEECGSRQAAAAAATPLTPCCAAAHVTSCAALARRQQRAALTGIKGSVEQYQRKLKERQEVTAALSNWVGDVLRNRCAQRTGGRRACAAHGGPSGSSAKVP